MLWTLLVCLLLTGARISAQQMANNKPKIIQALHITSDIKDHYATTLVSSRVVNPLRVKAAAVYSIILPESAYISKFLMEVNGRVHESYVTRKEEAGPYNEAIETGKFSAHVAETARNSKQFLVSIKVKARKTVTFNLTYEQALTREMGVYSNIISINPQQIVEDMTVTVNIVEHAKIIKLKAFEHRNSSEYLQDSAKQSTIARVEEKSPKHKQVFWKPTAEQQSSRGFAEGLSQFVVKYDVDHTTEPQEVVVDDCLFVQFFSPENLARLKKHVVFVLDYSGSMEGRKIEQLKEAMDTILSDLDPKDYFSIVIFHTDVVVWSPNGISMNSFSNLDHRFVVEASSANKDSARIYLSQYSDLHATNIMGGLRTGLQLVMIGSEMWKAESSPPQPVVVFLTDGQPNTEVSDTAVIIDKITHLNNNTCPIYSLAFGTDADLHFMRKLSLSNKGSARQIYEAKDASHQLQNFFKTVATPLLSNIIFNYRPDLVDMSSLTKTNFPVYFSGSEITVAGKLKKCIAKEKEKIGEVKGISATGPETFPSVIGFVTSRSARSVSSHRSVRSSQAVSPGHLEKMWAYLTIQQSLDKADSLDEGEEKTQAKNRSLELALQYSFVTPVTSMIVVKPDGTKSLVDTTVIQPDSVTSGEENGGGNVQFTALSPSELENESENEQSTTVTTPSEVENESENGRGSALVCSTPHPILCFAFYILYIVIYVYMK